MSFDIDHEWTHEFYTIVQALDDRITISDHDSPESIQVPYKVDRRTIGTSPENVQRGLAQALVEACSNVGITILSGLPMMAVKVGSKTSNDITITMTQPCIKPLPKPVVTLVPTVVKVPRPVREPVVVKACSAVKNRFKAVGRALVKRRRDCLQYIMRAIAAAPEADKEALIAVKTLLLSGIDPDDATRGTDISADS